MKNIFEKMMNKFGSKVETNTGVANKEVASIKEVESAGIELSAEEKNALSLISKNPKLTAAYEAWKGKLDSKGMDMQEKFINFINNNPGEKPGYDKVKEDFRPATSTVGMGLYGGSGIEVTKEKEAMQKIMSDESLKNEYDLFKGEKDNEGNDMQAKFLKFVIDNPGERPVYNGHTKSFVRPIYENFAK